MKVKRMINNFFHLVREHKLRDAEKLLDDIKEEMKKSKMDQGYMNALEGLLLSSKKEGDKYLFLAQHPTSPEELKAIRREFESHVKNDLHDDYDKGYFQALLDYVNSLNIR